MDHYAWYRDALAGKKPPIHADHPQCGYFKRRDGKDGPWIAAAIWIVGDKFQCRVGKKMVDDVDAEWTWLAKNPIAESEARQFFQTGQWPGEPDKPTIGDNRPDDPFAALTLDVEAELDAARELARQGVDSKGSADRFGNRIAALREITKRAEDSRTSEKAPHLAAGRAVDAKFQPMVAKLEAATKHLRELVGKWMAAEEARQREEHRKAEEARRAAEAERRRLEAEAEAKNLPPPVEAELPPLPDIEPVAVKAGGIVGRAVTLRTVKRCVITDHKKALKKFADHEEIKALVAKLAEKSMRAGHAVPGAELIEERIAA